MNKKDASELTSDMLVADALLRIKTLESLLLAKGIFTQEEYYKEMDEITKVIAKSILQKANVPGGLDDLINTLQGKSKKPANN